MPWYLVSAKRVGNPNPNHRPRFHGDKAGGMLMHNACPINSPAAGTPDVFATVPGIFVATGFQPVIHGLEGHATSYRVHFGHQQVLGLTLH